MPRALISVTDKTGLEKFGALVANGWEIISTGGTAKRLRELGIPCRLIEEITGVPEMMGGRVKTLNHKIFAGILADRHVDEHMQALKALDTLPIDLVVVNLYDFKNNPGIEHIDIGGPSQLRAAAKNFEHVGVVVRPEDYDLVVKQYVEGGDLSRLVRIHLMRTVFETTAAYDARIAEWALGLTSLAVAVSGTGSLLEAIIAADLPVGFVVADRPCRGLEIAKAAGIPHWLLPRTFGRSFDQDARDIFSDVLALHFKDRKIKVVAMAGFMTVLTERYFEHFRGLTLNIHPSLLPKFKGDNAVADALESGDYKTGTTVHVATLELDDGPILGQAEVPIKTGDTKAALHERIKKVERELYPKIIAEQLALLAARAT